MLSSVLRVGISAMSACRCHLQCLRMEPPAAIVSRCHVGRSNSCRRLKQYKQALTDARLALEADIDNPYGKEWET